MEKNIEIPRGSAIAAVSAASFLEDGRWIRRHGQLRHLA